MCGYEGVCVLRERPRGRRVVTRVCVCCVLCVWVGVGEYVCVGGCGCVWVYERVGVWL